MSLTDSESLFKLKSKLITFKVEFFFFTLVNSIQGRRTTQGRGVLSEIVVKKGEGGNKKCILCRYVGYILVDSGLEVLKSVVVRETSSRESVLQSNGFGEAVLLITK